METHIQQAAQQGTTIDTVLGVSLTFLFFTFGVLIMVIAVKMFKGDLDP
jgi:hypothetical protein